MAARAAADRDAGARFGKRALHGTKIDKSKAPATVRGRYIRKKAERQKADPSPTFAKNRRPGFGMTLRGKEASQKRQSEDRRHVTVAFGGQPECEKEEISPGRRNDEYGDETSGSRVE